ncbi:hypothetical protein DV702_03195 [Sporosarcina sp. PTS2304]|uniref:hypothetical protein n=1 Tax=Sporosarcina sp. PTS2304 TaxID=2283194 RepID=UPI000E0CE279|nr:hypothetical protein [Sporosarcina sp. PTS2304]AXH98816.1 hypothetical protein DV702_03195 [Sporosarcina sp. PTS2304]
MRNPKITYEQYTTEQLTFPIEEPSASLRGLEKVHTEFGIVALVHNLLKVAGIRRLLSTVNDYKPKSGGEKQIVFLRLFILSDY